MTETLFEKAPQRKFFDWRYVRKERRRPYRMAFILFWGILMYFASKDYIVSLEYIADHSMQPTVRKDAYYLVNRYIYNFADPERGDIVVLQRGSYGSAEEVKRVIGLPGDTVQIKSGAVYINGDRLDEPYASGPTFPDYGPNTMGEDAYFVLTDHRGVREDSRDYGPVPVKMIEGKIKPGDLFPFR
ncbi:MAG: signal peptidase I [candidate division NC10 bacterium]|jgi:signal peptidase I